MIYTPVCWMNWKMENNHLIGNDGDCSQIDVGNSYLNNAFSTITNLSYSGKI